MKKIGTLPMELKGIGTSPMEWELKGIERAEGIILSWRFKPHQLKEVVELLAKIPQKEATDPNSYKIARYVEAIMMGLSEEALYAQRKSIPDSGNEIATFNLNRPVTGGGDFVNRLVNRLGWTQAELYWEKGVSQNHLKKGKSYKDFRVCLVFVKKVKKRRKGIEQLTEGGKNLLNQLYQKVWCCHIWDNTRTKNQNFTLNYVHPRRGRSAKYTIVPGSLQ